MKAYTAFIKKELTELTRTYKLLIMGILFFVFGVMGPITAKYMPQLLSSFMPEGMHITLSEPTVMDAWLQFFKNVPQMGCIVLVIVFCGMMPGELTKGTLINMLTKGLHRSTVIYSKLTAAILVWTGAYAICAGVSYGYTCFFWAERALNALPAVLLLWLFGIMLLCLTIFGGVLFKNGYGSLLFTGFIVVVLMLMNIIPQVQDYNPMMLASMNTSLMSGELVVGDFTAATLICCGVSVGAIAGAVVVFNKKMI